MIIGKINYLDKNENIFNLKYLDKILDIINDIQTKNLKDGSYEIIGKNLIQIISTYETSKKEERLAEVHKKYIDFQYMQYGGEYIGYAPLLSSKKVFEPYNDISDIEKYNKVEDESYFLLNSGMFAIFFPNDIHRPGIIAGNKRNVRKFVFKIAI